MSDKLFGTDGIRGIANTYPLNIDFCTHLALVLSRNFCTRFKKVAIARDTRISGDMLFSALCAGFTSQGIDVINLGVVPTPFCTTVTPLLKVDMSIMITASHNPYRDNGLKLIAASGDKFSDSQTTELETLLSNKTLNDYSPENIGKIENLNTALSHYLQKAAEILPADSLKNLKIAFDSANGAFSGIAVPVLKSLGATVINLADAPNGYNINQDCGSQHTQLLSDTVVTQNCDIGVAVDGDGDRIIICDEQGKRLDGDQIIAFLAAYFQRHAKLKGNTVVATIYSNLGLGKYITSLGLTYHTSAVGERYVIEEMRKTGANIGGEESGHMVLSDYTRTGDALLTALVICGGIAEIGKKTSEIFPLFTPFPNQTHNLRYGSKEKIAEIMNNPEIQSAVNTVSAKLAGHGSLIVRKSGTEPVIRLKIEDENPQNVEAAATELLACFAKFAED
jgi:phosphoglucosamine mutase